MDVAGLLTQLLNGFQYGLLLFLIASGLTLIFGVMGIINMAHGEMVMLGAYTTFVVQETIRQHIPGLFDYSLLFAVPLAFLVAGLVGVAIVVFAKSSAGATLPGLLTDAERSRGRGQAQFFGAKLSRVRTGIHAAFYRL